MAGSTPEARNPGAFGVYDRLIDAIVVLGKGNTPIYANPACLRILDVSSFADFLERWEGLCGPLDVALSLGDNPVTTLSVSLRERGRIRSLKLTAQKTQAVVNDATHTVIVEEPAAIEALYRDLQLAARSRGISTIYKVLLHDAKAPMNAIVLNLDMLRETILVPDEGDEDVQERQLRYIDTVRRELGRVNRSLKGVLSRAGSTSDATRSFDFRRLLRELTSLVRPMARNQNVKIATALPTERVQLFGPRDRIKQAILNLVINSLEAMPRGGLLRISLDVEKHTARLSIKDTGVGIPPAMLDRVFEMHYTTKRQGSGIGLFVARAVISSQEGEIHLTSVPGEGSEAHVSLPLPASPEKKNA